VACQGIIALDEQKCEYQDQEDLYKKAGVK
jgi:hypothetical protein